MQGKKKYVNVLTPDENQDLSIKRKYLVQPTVLDYQPIPFECYQTDRKIIAQGYHWETPDTNLDGVRLSEKPIDNRAFYFCDDWYTWLYFDYYKKYRQDCRLYIVDYILYKPLVLLDQFEDFEALFNPEDIVESDTKSLKDAFLLEGGYDSIIYTSHSHYRGMRQGVLLNPSKSILQYQEVQIPDTLSEYWSQNHLDESKIWTDIMLKNKLQKDKK